MRKRSISDLIGKHYGHWTDIVDYGDHYLEIAKRWFNGNMWAGFGETVIRWQWLPEFPAELLFEDMEEG